MPVEYEAVSKFAKPLLDPGNGMHLWIMQAVFKMTDPASVAGKPVYLDNENLLTVIGPTCFKCEWPYSKSRDEMICTGSVSELQDHS